MSRAGRWSTPQHVEVAHSHLAEALSPGARALDATAGNGHDTAFLAEQVGAGGRVEAFDIQAAAIAASQARLASLGLGDRVTWHLASHAALAERLAAPVQAAAFNLGYLPGGDKAQTTRAASTLAALEALAGGLLAPGGALAVTCYIGHPGGAEEAAAVLAWFEARDAGWLVAQWRRLGRPQAPFVILAERAR